MLELIQEVRSEQNIFSAWRHVKRSALSSVNDEIRGAASEFEHAHQRHLRRIIDQLRDNRFVFDPVTGVLKEKKKREALKKEPRPIAIATLKNRIVQRAILQILQPRRPLDLTVQGTRYELERDNRLGKINDVNRSRFGVGGLLDPYGGVFPAIKLISDSIKNGARYYYQSDIKSFFTNIPTHHVVDFVRFQTGDEAFTNLFSKALEVHLRNGDELKSYSKLFPRNGIGVAQGSSLSAFSGNVLLYDMDHQLNGMGVTAVRYIDDILIVADSESILDDACSFAKRTLKEFGFDLYDPIEGKEGKASRGECVNSINFLGCSIQPNRCVPSNVSIKNFRNDISQYLSRSKNSIRCYLKESREMNPKFSFSATLDAVGKKVFGWRKSFSFCTNDNCFNSIDTFVTRQVLDYEAVVRRMTKDCSPSDKMVVLGIQSMRKI